MANGNISGEAIIGGLNSWMARHKNVASTLANPFMISILILLIIWLLDIVYNKSFECASSREILQHSLTAFFVMIIGIIINNQAVSTMKCITRPQKEDYHGNNSITGLGESGSGYNGSGRNRRETLSDIKPNGSEVSIDTILAEYVE